MFYLASTSKKAVHPGALTRSSIKLDNHKYRGSGNLAIIAVTMRYYILLSPQLLSLTCALTVPPLRARQESSGPADCSPLTATNPSSFIPHSCTNDVLESNTPSYYSTYIDANYLFDYDSSTSSGASSDVTGNYPLDDTYIIPQSWILTCNVDNICNDIPAANESISVPTGEWITDYTNPNCLMGFRFPNSTSYSTYAETAQYPTREDCIHRIMGPMLVELAAKISTASANTTLEEQIPNRASVNLAENGFPDFLYGDEDSSGPSADGTPVAPEWPMWFVQGWPSS